MATATQVKQQKLRADDIFFPAVALLILVIVITGFAQSYFLAGMVRAKLPNKLVHIHGAIFVSWIFLLVIQNALAATRKIRWHITLGIFGFILPPLMVVFGVLTLFDSLRRNGTDLAPQLILVGDLEVLFIFAVLTGWGLWVRRDAIAHKRLMILGTLELIGTAINRWPWPDAIRLPGTLAIMLLLPLIVVAYDLWSRRKVHHTTVVGTLMIEASILTLLPVTQLSIWQPLIHWIQHS